MSSRPLPTAIWSLPAVGALGKTYAQRDPGTEPDFSTLASFCPTARPIFLFVGDHLTPQKTICMHSHPCVAMHGCLRGPVTLVSAAGERVLEAGAFYLLAPGFRHGGDDGPHTVARISFLIDTDHAGSWPTSSGIGECCRKLKSLVCGLHRFNVAGDADLQCVFWQLADCLGSGGSGERITTMGLLWTLLGLALERLGRCSPATTAPADAAHQIQRLLVARIADRLTLEAVAAEVGISATQAKRVFRQTYGCGIMAYFDQLKIQQAKRLLCDPLLSIKQVSRRLGFSNPSYFAQVFHRHTGERPRDFRNPSLER